MNLWLAVAIGAAVGAPLRYLVDRAVTNRVAGVQPPREFPWGLAVVNIVGSLVAGIVFATASGEWRVLLISGLCGAFTTFSGFAWELDRLWSVARTAFWSAAVLVPVACVGAFWVAWRLAGIAFA
jgi:CrcB protein